MKITITPVFVVLLALAMGCATQPALQNINTISHLTASALEENRVPKLLLEAHPRVGFAPLRVSVKAVLDNVPSRDPIFDCIWESWVFGDGAVSSQKTSCDGSEYEVNSDYFVEHVYREKGVYNVRFVLGNNQVLSNTVQIRVLGTTN